MLIKIGSIVYKLLVLRTAVDLTSTNFFAPIVIMTVLVCTLMIVEFEAQLR